MYTNLDDKNDDKILGFIHRGITFRPFTSIRRIMFPRKLENCILDKGWQVECGRIWKPSQHVSDGESAT